MHRAMDIDRTVYGSFAVDSRCEGPTLVEIVRYDRAGKWYAEPLGGIRWRVTTKEAARLASTGRRHIGLPGGGAFDRAIRALERGTA